MPSPGTTIEAAAGRGSALCYPTRWCQFHLLTAVVAVFVAGGLLWANVRERMVTGPKIILFPSPLPTEAYAFADEKISDLHWIKWEFGWPLSFLERSPGFILSLTPKPFGNLSWNSSGCTWDFSSRALAVDLAICLSVLAAVAFLTEWLIRRQARRSGAS